MTAEELDAFNLLLKENQTLLDTRKHLEQNHQDWLNHARFIEDAVVRQTVATERIAEVLIDYRNRQFLGVK